MGRMVLALAAALRAALIYGEADRLMGRPLRWPSLRPRRSLALVVVTGGRRHHGELA